MAELAMSPTVLAEMVALIENNTISGKIAKQILPDLLKVPPTLQSCVCGQAFIKRHRSPITIIIIKRFPRSCVSIIL